MGVVDFTLMPANFSRYTREFVFSRQAALSEGEIARGLRAPTEKTGDVICPGLAVKPLQTL